MSSVNVRLLQMCFCSPVWAKCEICLLVVRSGEWSTLQNCTNGEERGSVVVTVGLGASPIHHLTGTTG